jgi:predicted ribonuclease toxin of YeeF-YezG toxin-antitoxin module
MVETQLKEAAYSIKEASEKQLDYILGLINDHLVTVLTDAEKKLDTTIEKVKSLDAKTLIQETEQSTQELAKLSKDLVVLSNNMGA